MMAKLRRQPLLLLIATMTSLADETRGMTSFKPVVDPVDNTILCANDPPTTVVPLADVSVGIPVGISDAVVCGFGCTGYNGCSSYNYRKPRTEPAQCEFHTKVPRNCSTKTMASNEQCHHYELSEFRRSCLPPVCDVNCISGCLKQGEARCDSLCGNGTALAKNFTCQPCGANCAGGCTQNGPGTCDLCLPGFALNSAKVCQVIAINCLLPYQSFDNVPQSCYKLVTVNPKMWTEAQKDCENDGRNAHLAYIDSDVEQKALAKLASTGNNDAWIGGCRIKTTGSTFVWSNKCSNNGVTDNAAVTQNMTYSRWIKSDATAPSGSTGCVRMDNDPYDGETFRWNPTDCTGQNRNYICEYNN